MSAASEDREIGKLGIGIVMMLAIVAGIAVAASISDSDGALEEQQIIKYTTATETRGTIYDGENIDDNKLIDIRLYLYEGENAKFIFKGMNSRNTNYYNEKYIAMRCVTDGNYDSPGYAYESLSYFKSSNGSQITGTYHATAGREYEFVFRVCKTSDWSSQEPDTNEVTIKFSAYGVTQYTYSTSVTYDANGGTSAPSVTATGKQTVETLPTGTDAITISSELPVWEGHTFLGWSTSKSGTPTISAGSVQDLDKGSDITVYAQWELKVSKLRLMSEGEVFKTAAADWGSTISIPADIPEKDGCIFIGWSATEGSKTAEYYPGTELALKDDIDLYAVWDREPIDFTLTFNANEGTGAPEKMTKNSKEDSCAFTIPSTLPTLKGYGCVGWSTVKNGDLQYKPGDEISVPYGEPNEVLYAVWVPAVTYTLSFNANGGENAPATVRGESIDSSVSLRVPLDEPTRSGYRFVGWAAADDAIEAEHYAGQSVEISSKEVTLYAVWEKLPVLYSLAFDANGGEGVPTANAVRTTEASVSIVIPAGTPEWEGHLFVGWSESKTSTNAEYKAGDSVALADSKTTVTLYAVWKELRQFVLSFDANGGENAPAQISGWSPDSEYAVSIPADVPTKDDCRFVGWSSSKDVTAAEVQRGEQYTMKSATVTLYAVWEWTTEMTFSLSFDAGEGTGAPESKSGTAKAPSLAFDIPSDIPVREGFAFAGWALAEGSETPDYAAGGRIVLTAESTVLHAVWKEIVSYTLSFNANGGENAPESVAGTSTEGSCVLTVPTKVPERDGFRFLGWSVSKETIAPEISPGQSMTVTGDVLLYAIWNEVVSFTMSFDANGGEGAPAAVTGESDTGSCRLAIPEGEPSRSGFSFLGWSRDSKAAEPEFRAGDSVELSVRAMTMYAVWKQFPSVAFDGQSEITVVVGFAQTVKVSWTPSSAAVTAEGPSWMSFDNGTVTINAPAAADVGEMTLTAKADGYTETVWTLTVRAIPPEDAASVAFQGNGASDSYVFVAKGEKLAAPADPSLEGRAFDGWYTQSGEQYDFDAPVTGDLVLVAHWTDAEQKRSVPVAWILAGILAIAAGLIVARRYI